MYIGLYLDGACMLPLVSKKNFLEFYRLSKHSLKIHKSENIRYPNVC